ncbi:cytochrome P460 family protein [Pantoea coffeiphila]|uniref:cytochrome P460 family protein n=1 Tax=Pantoea coffeiphila TaxID=1465635 RepID=UPI00195FA991|nr:cytochrome P460 family protein [Pantoea coffeiphila]MBM7341773.1 hypothetical protein [Pantoea coffeiphila]
MTKILTGRCGSLRVFLRLNFPLEGHAERLQGGIRRRLIQVAALPAAFPALLLTNAFAAEPKVVFPSEYAQGKHYASIVRGDTREELYTTPEVIAAASRGEPLPEGTVITMEDYRNNQLYRYVVMEKRKGWGQAHPAELRTGDWEFQWFNPDRSVRPGENLDRCRACHTSQAGNDYVFSYDRMKEAN